MEVIGIETSEEEKPDLEMGTGDMPAHRVEVGDFLFEDYPGDVFEKLGEINLEKTPQTPSEPILTVPSGETPITGKPRRKRIKTLAERTDLPRVRKLLAQQSQTSLSAHKSPKQPTQPTRKSHRLVAQGFVRRSSSTKQGPPMIKEIVSTSEGSPIKDPEAPAELHVSPVLGSE